MIEDIYKWLESSGWERKIIDDNRVKGYIKTNKFASNTMIVNGQRIEAPPIVVKTEIEYAGDGWISNSDDSDRIELTEWDVRVCQGNNVRSITLIVDSLDQFIETINEMNI